MLRIVFLGIDPYPKPFQQMRAFVAYIAAILKNLLRSKGCFKFLIG
jgi:hypothetical protein